MTVTEAARIWIAEKKRRQEVGPAFEEAERVLKTHFRTTGRSEYKAAGGRVGYARTIRRLLDNAKVKAHLGKRLPDFQRDTEVESLSLLPQG